MTQQLHDARDNESQDNYRPIQTKRRINLFYIDENKTLIFALYEDVAGRIHYRYMNYDTNKYKMHHYDFDKQFKLR